MKKTAVFKLVVNSDMSKDISSTLHNFIQQSLSISVGTDVLSSYSLRISYTGEDGATEYTVINTKKNVSNISPEKLYEETTHRLNNRRISLSSIKSLYMHLYYE